MSGWVEELRQILGTDALHTDEATRQEHAGDKWRRGELPAAVATPQTTAQVSALLAFADERSIPVVARGGGYGFVGSCVSDSRSILLSLRQMNRVREINDQDFVAVVEPGVLTLELQDAVRAHGLFYPPDPASSRYSTIGGNIATNAGGPRSLKYGVTRHYVLGLEVVLADGRVLQLGGRTHKNKTGFDLLSLFVGSEGMLGVVTQATLRLLPHPPARAGISAVFSTPENAATAVNAIFAAGLLPAAVELADGFTWRCFQEAEGVLPDGSGAHLLVEVDGQPEAVQAEIRTLERIVTECGASQIIPAPDAASCEALWAVRRRFGETITAAGYTRLNEDIVVPRGRLVDLMKFARELGEKHGIQVACFGHAGDGNIHVNLLMSGEMALDEAHQLAEPALDDLFAQVLNWGGAITGEHGIGLAKLRWWPQAISPEVLSVHQQLKSTLDPTGILNPGKFL